jgi:hypothetical protein
MVQRTFVRVLVASALCAAMLAFALTPIPIDATGDSDLPAPAFEQTGIYRMEIALMVFYGDLLLVAPAFFGLARGRLPIEISTRGAKFAEVADQSAARNETSIECLEATTERVAQRLDDAQIEIERLQRLFQRDSSQPEVDSKR